MKNKPSLPTVAIVGRPNVGKSSLFNAMLGRRLAIVHEESGVTRDRIAAPLSWRGGHLQLVDTGGLGTFAGERRKLGVWDEAIAAQVEAALEGAALVVFVVDSQAGMTPLDKEIGTRLRNAGAKVIVAATKADSSSHDAAAVEFAALGFGEPLAVSALHRRGVDDLLDTAADQLGELPEYRPEDPFRIAVVGRPNVGKSSFVNRIMGEERVMVSDIAGTTRDSVDIEFELNLPGESLRAILVDTAGLRRRSKVDTAVEHYSVMRAQAAIKRAQMVVFIVEADKSGTTAQDRHIARIIADSGKGCVLLANKWDKCGGEIKQKVVAEELRRTLGFMEYAPLVFTCALSGYNFSEVIDAIAEVRRQMDVQIPTSVVNRLLGDAVAAHAPQLMRGRHLKIYYGTMTNNRPPTFTLFVNEPKLCHANYLNYLRNQMRRSFGLTGFPIRIKMKPRPRRK